MLKRTVLYLTEAQRRVGAPETKAVRKRDTDFFLLGYIGDVVAVELLWRIPRIDQI
jgi:hypothetical protein